MFDFIVLMVLLIFGAFCIWFLSSPQSESNSTRKLISTHSDKEVREMFLDAVDMKGDLSVRVSQQKLAIQYMRENRAADLARAASYKRFSNVISLNKGRLK